MESSLRILTLCRTLLVVSGLLNCALYGSTALFATQVAERDIAKEIERAEQEGLEVDFNAVEQLRPELIRINRITGYTMAGIGVVFLILAGLIRRWPIPVTVVGIFVEIGDWIGWAFFNPTRTTDLGPIAGRLLVLFALVRALIVVARERADVADESQPETGRGAQAGEVT